MEIITKRFLLREFIEEDEPAFLAYHADPWYADCDAPEAGASDHTRALFRRFRQWAVEEPRHNYQLAISDIRSPQKLLGCCGLRRAGYGPHQAELSETWS
jgi:[ribosomal protein S5]-alanine N-acetyltransferase